MKDLIYSKEQSTCLKSILPLFIVLHHLSFKTEILDIPILHEIGKYIVALFLFTSGYGLTYGISHKTNYLESFFKKRILPVLIPYVLCAALYNIMYVFCEGFLPLMHLEGVLKGDTNSILPASWFVWIILLLYVLFWLSFSLKIDFAYRIIILIFNVGIVFVLLHVWGFPGYWYNALGAFISGVVWSYCIKNQSIKNKRVELIFALTAITICSFFIQSLIGTLFRLALLPIIFIIIMSSVTCSPPIILCEISYEIYLTHVISYRFLRSDIIYISNDYLFVLSTYILTFCLAFIIHKFYKNIISNLHII